MVLEISVNGEKRFSVDGSEHGQVTVVMHGLGGETAGELPNMESNDEPRVSLLAMATKNLKLSASALLFGRAKSTHSYWPNLDLKCGDEITVRVLAEGHGDAPAHIVEGAERVKLAPLR